MTNLIKKQKGFIQIPILIMLLVVGATSGGAYFWGEREYKGYQAEKNEKENQALALAETQRKALEEARTEIEKLKIPGTEIQKKEIKTKVDEVKPNQPKPQIVKIDIPPPVVSQVVSAPINPALQCLSTKSGWDNFATALYGLQIVPILDSYDDLAFGTKNRPTSANALFAYNYTRLNSGRSKFYSQTREVRNMINVLPPLPYEASIEFEKIKKGHLDALTHLENSYELSLQAFKIYGDNPDGYISQNDVNTSQSLLKDLSDEYDQVYPSLKGAFSVVSKLQTDMREWKDLGCAFTFNEDWTVKTTINEEYLFTQQYPKSNAKDGSNTTLSISTKLPTTINDNGQTKQVLTLLCNPGKQFGVFPASRLNENSVGAIIRSTEGGRHQCFFSYIGNGRAIYTRMFDFNF